MNKESVSNVQFNCLFEKKEEEDIETSTNKKDLYAWNYTHTHNGLLLLQLIFR